MTSRLLMMELLILSLLSAMSINHVCIHTIKWSRTLILWYRNPTQPNNRKPLWFPAWVIVVCQWGSSHAMHGLPRQYHSCMEDIYNDHVYYVGIICSKFYCYMIKYAPQCNSWTFVVQACRHVTPMPARCIVWLLYQAYIATILFYSIVSIMNNYHSSQLCYVGYTLFNQEKEWQLSRMSKSRMSK